MTRAALSLLLLAAACSKPAERNEGAGMTESQVAAEAKKLKLAPGAWQTTTVITDMAVSGVPASALEAATGTPTISKSCITPAEAARPDADILSGTKDGDCRYQRFSMAGNRIDAAMTCTPPRLGTKMAMTLTGDYAATGFNMGMTMKSDLPGKMAMSMKATVKGERTGECTGTEDSGS